MSGATGALVGAAVVGAGATVYAANKSASAQNSASGAAINAQQQALDKAQQNTAYSRALGNGADSLLAKAFGMNLGNSGVNLSTGGTQPWNMNQTQGGPNTGPSGGYALGPDGKNGQTPFLGHPAGNTTAPGANGPNGVNAGNAPNGVPYGHPGMQVGPNGASVPGGSNTGTTPPGGGQSPDYSGFYNTPGFQYSLKLGNQAVQRGAAATGGLYNTGTLAALSNYNVGAASSHYNDYVSQLMQMAGLGAGSAQSNAQNAVTTGQGISNSYTNQGISNASAASATGGAITGLVGKIADIYKQQNNPATTTPAPSTDSNITGIG